MKGKDKKKKKKAYGKKIPKQATKKSELKNVGLKSYDPTVESLVSIAVESFRFCNTCMNVASKLNEKDSVRFKNKYEWFSSQLVESCNKAGLTIRDFKGLDYDPGYPITAINLEEFDTEADLIISHMLEPVIMVNGDVMHMGVVMLDRKGKEEV